MEENYVIFIVYYYNKIQLDITEQKNYRKYTGHDNQVAYY